MNDEKTGKNWSQLTKYPKVFGRCYWGSFPERKVDFEDLPQLIVNRNKFAEDYKLQRCIGYKVSMKIKKETIIPKHDYNKDFAGKYKITYPKAEFERLQYEFHNDTRDHREYYLTKDKKIVAIFTSHNKDEEYEKAIKMGFIEVPSLYAIGQISLLKIMDR